MDKEQNNGRKNHYIHLRAGQETIDILNAIQKNFGLNHSKAIRYALQNVDFSEGIAESIGRGGETTPHSVSSVAEQDSKTVTYPTVPLDVKELTTLQSLVKVLRRIKKDLHRIGSNLNQEAHRLNLDRTEGNTQIKVEDVVAMLDTHDKVLETHGQVKNILNRVC